MKMEQPIKVMNKEQYNQIIDEAYLNFEKWYNERSGKEDYTGYYVPTKEEFIRLIKTDSEFSKNWGLKIEERELSWDERADLSREKRRTYANWQYWSLEEMEYHLTDVWNIPTRLITLTYNNETIESYE